MAEKHIIAATEEEYFYLSSSLIFGKRDSRTKKYSIWKFPELSKAADLPMKEYGSVHGSNAYDSGRFSITRAVKIKDHVLECRDVDGSNLARTLTLHLYGKMLVSDSLVSEEHFSRLDNDIDKTQTANVHAVAVLIKILNENWFLGMPVLVNDLPNIAALILHEREKLKRSNSV